MEIKGAGGTSGGVSRFFVGLGMLGLGLYLFLQSVQVHSGFSLGYRLYSFGSYGLTSGMILIPFMFGVGMVFYNSKNPIGWVLAVGSLVALIGGVIASLHFRLRSMTTFDLLVILVLTVGGAGIFLSSLKESGGEASEPSSP